jgi:hypothetical protein
MNNPSLSATADRINDHNDSDAGGGESISLRVWNFHTPARSP